MKERITRIILLAALAALGYWCWTQFCPRPEKVIRKRLESLAREASFSSKGGLMAQAWNATSLGEYFTTNVQVTIDVPGSQHSLSGRDELMRTAVGVRQMVRSLTIEFPDIKVTVAPGGETAVVNLTARGKVAGQRKDYLQELRLCLIKVKRDWLIYEIITVRTLS
jgi:hypothetical protein